MTYFVRKKSLSFKGLRLSDPLTKTLDLPLNPAESTPPEPCLGWPFLLEMCLPTCSFPKSWITRFQEFYVEGNPRNVSVILQ